jgi:hypothetical protein
VEPVTVTVSFLNADGELEELKVPVLEYASMYSAKKRRGKTGAGWFDEVSSFFFALPPASKPWQAL